MDTVTFKHNGATLEVRKETVRDVLMQEVIEGELSQQRPDDLFNMHYRYAKFVTTTKVVNGKLGFNIPSIGGTSTDESIKALIDGLESFLSQDRDFYYTWRQAYRDVNGPKAETVPETESETS